LSDPGNTGQVLVKGRNTIDTFFGGIFMKSITMCAALASAALFSFVAPASAGTIVMTGSSASTGGAAGNILSFNDGAGISVQASAFSIVNGVTQAAYLGAYGSGLGVTNSLEGDGSAGASHTVDNYQATGTGFDFILLVFNKAVNLSTAVLSPFQVASTAADNDAFVNRGTLANAFQASPTAVSTANALSIANAAGGKNVAGNLASGNSTALNMANSYANVWVIGAARSSYTAIDSNADGFKLKSVTATAAVPEPATWGMMIGGMGIAGMALRRRRRAAVAQVIA
jgi:PEP-CTERM motif